MAWRRRSVRGARTGTRFAGIAALVLLAACTAPTERPLRVVPPPAGAAEPPKTMQWLYGSGEAGAASIQAYQAFMNHVLQVARSQPRDSVVLAEGSTLDAPRWVPCGARPLAVVLDVDETVLLNLGYEYHEARTGRPYSQEVWNRWEQSGAGAVAPVPGAVFALRRIRDAGVDVMFITNRQAANAVETERAINDNFLGPARQGETLFLQGDFGSGSAKDSRRAHVASRYCVIAMAGDQLGDFSDLFNDRTLPIAERRRLATGGALAGRWGNGWFLLPNPVYGSGVRGSFDDVFPEDRRWTDPAGGNE